MTNFDFEAVYADLPDEDQVATDLVCRECCSEEYVDCCDVCFKSVCVPCLTKMDLREGDAIIDQIFACSECLEREIDEYLKHYSQL